MRGYQWTMTYRGFEVLYREHTDHTVAYMADGVAVRMEVEPTQYECYGTFDLSTIDLFWDVETKAIPETIPNAMNWSETGGA